MKLRHHVLFLFVAEALCAGQADAPRAKLRQSTRDHLETIRATTPVANEILATDDRKGTVVKLSSIEPAVIANACGWIRRVVRPEWLPDDLEGSLVAYKDTILTPNKRLPNGMQTGSNAADYFICDVEKGGRRICIMESGVDVSVRVDFSGAVPAVGDSDEQVFKWMREYLDLPSDAPSLKAIKISATPPIFQATPSWPFPTPPKTEGEFDARRWWDWYHVVSDGTFFFVYVPELTPGIYHYTPRLGRMRRFP